MASHWTSDPRSSLKLFFLNLASHFPWLDSSCNNQNPNRTTTSASHSGASPARWPVVDDSDSAIDIETGGIHTSNVHGTGSTTARSFQTRNFNSSQSGPVHLIAKMFQGHELGKVMLESNVSMTMGLLISQHQGLTHLQASAIVLALSVGFVTLWNGMLLHDICPRVASVLEHAGVGTILVAYFGLVSSFLPASFLWMGWLCCGLSCLPFLLCLVLRWCRKVSSTERLHLGTV